MFALLLSNASYGFLCAICAVQGRAVAEAESVTSGRASRGPVRAYVA